MGVNNIFIMKIVHKVRYIKNKKVLTEIAQTNATASSSLERPGQ